MQTAADIQLKLVIHFVNRENKFFHCRECIPPAVEFDSEENVLVSISGKS